MIKLILVRHGKTTCNEKGALSGLTDSVLSETGKLQSQKIADYLKYTNIDKIYTTPFKRTKETIEKLAETKNIKVEESSQLNEINFGDFEGLSFKDIEKNHPEEVQKMIKDGDKYKYPNGESLEDTFVRVKKEIDNNNLIIFIVVEKNINFAITISMTTVYTMAVINIPNVALPMNILPIPFSLGVTVL